MANYAPLSPANNQVLVVPSSTSATMIRAWNGDLLISSDTTFNRASAFPLLNGEVVKMPANVTWRISRLLGRAELRRMDISE